MHSILRFRFWNVPMLRDTFGHADAAQAIEHAVGQVLESGFRTADIATSESAIVSTLEMGDAVALRLSKV